MMYLISIYILVFSTSKYIQMSFQLDFQYKVLFSKLFNLMQLEFCCFVTLQQR